MDTCPVCGGPSVEILEYHVVECPSFIRLLLAGDLVGPGPVVGRCAERYVVLAGLTLPHWWYTSPPDAIPVARAWMKRGH